MAFMNPSNQLIQIDTGNARTYLFNAAQSKVSVYANIGESQVLGQRYVGISGPTIANPAGAPAIYMLVKYLATSATTTGNLVAGPAPVYWTDNTFTTVSGISSESGFLLNGIAGYMMPNTTDILGLTNTLLLGSTFLIQVAGYLPGAYGPTTGGPGVAGNRIVPVAGTFTSSSIAAGTAVAYRGGVQLTAVASTLCDVLVDTDFF